MFLSLVMCFHTTPRMSLKVPLGFSLPLWVPSFDIVFNMWFSRYVLFLLISKRNIRVWILPPVGLSGLEPPTSRLSGVRSNRLSYKPSFFESGTHLLSHIVSNIVPSAAYALTVVFGMGTGVSHKRISTGISSSYFLLFYFFFSSETSFRESSLPFSRLFLFPL